MTAGARQHATDFFFLPGTCGQLFAALRSPADDQPCTAAVLCVMPLAEEMNRCRHLVAEQSCALARNGVMVLCIDAYGCGDSEGEFADADWQTWIEDLRLARDWLATRTGLEPDIWAIRHGALLAAAAFGDAPPRRLLMWQPVVSGAAALSEMLRVAVASSMLSGSDKPRTVEALRAAVLDGDALEVGGYLINPDLARALNAVSLDPWPFVDSSVDWIEIAPEGADTASAQSTSDSARSLGVNNLRVPGRRFWSSPDVFENDDLISATTRALSLEEGSL